MNKKRACIFGIAGQDGSYLAEYLLSLGYEVHGMVRRNSTPEGQQTRLNPIHNINVVYGDLTDQSSIDKFLSDVMPDEIYALAAQSHVRISFDIPQYTVNTNAMGVLNILESYKRICPNAKFYQASSSEMFGLTVEEDGFQRETTVMNPVSPYGCFPKGTKILFFDQTIKKVGKNLVNGILKNKNIEDIKIGDLVLSYNTITGEKEYKPVLSTMERDNEELYLIKFSNGNFIECTEEHPFYIHGKEWVEAKNLNIGDKAIQYLYSGLNSRTSTDVSYSMKYSKEKINEMALKKSNSMKIAWQTSEKLDPETYSKKFKDNRKNWRAWNNGLTKETNDTLQQMSLNSKGKKVNEEAKLKIAKTVSELWEDAEYIFKQVQARGQRPNNHEKIVIDILNEICPNEFDYNGGYELKCMIGRKIPDFVHKSKNKVIEYFGEYWHSKEYKDSDEATIKKYNDNGYDCLVIWENDLFNNREEVKKRILNFLYNKKTEIVEVISIEKINKRQKVYNFEVKDNNNYYAFGLLVHNCSKVFGFNITRHYRRAYNLFISNGILFNHEGPRRGSNFVTSKVVKGACMIKLGLADKLEMGNMDSYRDWGHSRDYIKAMHMILNHDKPDDFVVSTMETHSVRDMCDVVFKYLGLDYKDYVVQNPKFLRPEELPYLKGDSTKIRETLGWKPTITFEEMMHEMCDHWMDVLQGKTSYR